MGEVFRQNALRAGFFLALALVACAPGTPTPINDRVSLSYQGASDSGAAFNLENGLHRAIQVRGAKYSWVRTEPVEPINVGWVCRIAGSAVPGDEPFAFVDGDYKVVQVPPGRTLHLNVTRRIPSQYRGGRCHLHLRLEDGTDIFSSEFTPSSVLKFEPSFNDLSRRKPGE
jgi:hypothetical protein